MSVWEIIGTVLGVLGVGLMIRQKVWAWPVGIVQVAVSAWVFYAAKLYSDAILQIFFIAIQAYGWWHWRRAPMGGASHLAVTRMRPGAILGWIAVGAMGTAGWGEFMRRTTDAALPHWDAFILVFSLISQWLQAKKRLENWLAWVIVDIVAVGVYWHKDLHLYAGLYLVFVGLALMGFVAWRKSLGKPPHA